MGFKLIYYGLQADLFLEGNFAATPQFKIHMPLDQTVSFAFSYLHWNVNCSQIYYRKNYNQPVISKRIINNGIIEFYYTII